MEDVDIRPGVELLDLRANQCRFAITPHDERHHRFCGKGTVPGMVYCPKHFELVRTPTRYRKLQLKERMPPHLRS